MKRVKKRGQKAWKSAIFGSKTAEKGPKTAVCGYRSVNRYFLQVTHYSILIVATLPKNALWGVGGGGGVPVFGLQEGEQTKNMTLETGGAFLSKCLLPVKAAGDGPVFRVAGPGKKTAMKMGLFLWRRVALKGLVAMVWRIWFRSGRGNGT